MSTDISTGNRVVARVLAPIVQTSRPSNGGGCFSVGCCTGQRLQVFAAKQVYYAH
uniref:ORF36a n=1 Tax=Cydia pomonella granulosis virus TaxID=28289 RepID=A0A097P0M7_GVCP|nr:ORF36a [Cydia pomonella granulovirus]AIU36825.1 ORF36a [Cydia pomonella granulovirus]AIU36962.1 ORF36a [Cydia pomonella granulovirus]AIU37104.1 ORF36a [Cydia pomonella granulovirus]AIU37245.1 ORF36a [Cydia pomonella granulovirus]